MYHQRKRKKRLPNPSTKKGELEGLIQNDQIFLHDYEEEVLDPSEYYLLLEKVEGKNGLLPE
jgi:hypothetical protein